MELSLRDRKTNEEFPARATQEKLFSGATLSHALSLSW